MYAKVFDQIFNSSIANDYELRHFFMDMLVLAEVDGVVDMTPEAISGRTRIPIDKVKGFLDQLESPDGESRCADSEGKRIVRLDKHRTWGWQIVNYQTYRDIASDVQRREKTKFRVRKHREFRQLELSNAPVTQCNASNAKQKQKQKQKQKHLEVLSIYEAYPRKVGRPKALIAITKALESESLEKLLESTKKLSEIWLHASKDEFQYCPHPATWFNQERYNDDPSTWKRSTGGRNRNEVDRNAGTANEGKAAAYANYRPEPPLELSNESS